MTKFREGDVVLVEGVVGSSYVLDDNRMKVTFEYNDLFVSTDNMKMVRPVLKTGDMVWNRNLQRFGSVLSIHGERLWVEADSDTFPTWLLADVERVETQSLADTVAIIAETPPSFQGATDE